MWLPASQTEHVCGHPKTRATDENGDERISHRELDTDAGDPSLQVVETVAGIEGVEPDELPTMYDCVDGVLDHLFSTPPAPEARMEVAFGCASYRITIEQNGRATSAKTE